MKNPKTEQDTKTKPVEDSVQKADPAGILKDAQQMVGQLQEQAKDGHIDGAVLDQLGAMLNVSVDTATDANSEGQSIMEGVSKTDDPASESTTSSEPSTDLPSSSEPSTEEPSNDEEEEPTEESEEPTTEEEEESTMKTEQDELNQPLSTKPPKTNLIFDKVDDHAAKLPEFIKALSAGRVKDAQQLSGNSGQAFDEMFKMAQVAILTEGGWTSDNLEKLSGVAQTVPGRLAKGITASTVPGIYLIKLAKLMLPLYAGLVSRMPSDTPKDMASDQATWKAQLGYGAIDWAGFFRAAEASVGVTPPTSFLTYNAAFNDLPVTDSVTLKALATGKGYSDPMQISVIKSMSSLLSAQEKVILGSNSGSIAAPGTVTVTAGSAGGTISNSGSAGSYVVTVTALSYEGWLAQSKGGSASVGESTATAASAATTGTGDTNSLVVDFAYVPGAVAYNIYLAATGAAGSSATWNKTVTINKATLTAASGSAALTAPAADSTVNALGIEGLISWCTRSTIYGNLTPSKVAVKDCAGAGLTAGNGGILEFDEVLAKQWTDWKIAPSLMVMSPNMNSTLVGKLQSLGSGTFYRVDVTQERNKVNGGMMVSGYVNKFAPFADGTPRMVDIIPHPDMPDGTILVLCETIPYPMGNESRGFVRDVLIPYTYFPLPSQVAGVNKILYNYSITTSEVVECFNPSPQTAIVGVDYSK
jgi:hypothetical protein